MLQQHNEKGLIAQMEEQHNIQIAHEQRITQVESRITVIEVKQSRIDAVFEKLTDMVSLHEKQGALHEAAIVAIKERTDQFASKMEDITEKLTDKQENQASMITGLQTKMGIIQAVALALMGILLTILAQHLFHF